MPRFSRLLPSHGLLLKLGLGLLVVIVVIVVVPPVRKAVALTTSKAIVFIASPLAPDIADFKQLSQTSRLLAIDGSVVAELDKSERRVPIEITKVPDHVKQAVLAAEDQDFYSHSGIDSSAVFRAFLRSAQGETQGGSTITQQLAKINYTAGERTLLRKFKEVLYATRLEKKYAKDELLERYLNQVYFGGGAYGINSAAELFFGTTADQLSAAQAAMLAGKIRAPEALDPRDPQDVAGTKKRRDQVLRNMHEEGWLDKAGLEEAVATPIEVIPEEPNANDGLGKAPHFSEYVKREARGLDALGASPETRENQLFTGGYTIETTFDPKVFDATVASVQEHLGVPEEDPDTAVATVQPGDGAIRSLFGGLDFSKTQYDMSSLSGRQAGSAFKPYVYLAALREKISPKTNFDGTSGRTIKCYGSKPVSNYAGEDHSGSINVDDAMVKSVNVVFVDLGCETGVRNVLETAQDAGIPEDAATPQGAIFLGGLDKKGVNALEMASSFATFAAKGRYAEPYSIARIKNRSGKVIYTHKVQTEEVFKAEEVGVLNNPLQRVVTEGTGKAAGIGRPVAGKTGTTQDNVDAWFVGYTPQLATGVWVGYPDENRPMTNVKGRTVTGGSFPAQIFSDVMKKAHEGVKVMPLFTASPDSLDLERATSTTSTSSTTSSSTTSSSTTSSSTTSSTSSTTTAPRNSTTTSPTLPRRTTSTTSSTTTTTTKKQTTTTSCTTTTTSSTSSTSTTSSSTTSTTTC